MNDTTSTKDTGGQAFPQSGAVGPSDDKYDSTDFGGNGMTLRDYFAGQALAGLIANTKYMMALGEISKKENIPSNKNLAISCYETADALIVERTKP